MDVAVLTQEEQWAMIAVRDQGVGIRAADLGRIFTRYFTRWRAAGQVGFLDGDGVPRRGPHEGAVR